MEDSNTLSRSTAALPLILLAAVVQGWALFALHHAVEHQQWPADQPSWLWALYALAVFVPLTVELLADRLHEPRFWLGIGTLTVVFFCFGWNHGAHLGPRRTVANALSDEGDFIAAAFVCVVWWLMVLPFVQNLLSRASAWRGYPALFANAWRNKLVLVEASLFTGLFWLLLMLWQTLFHMLRIDYFKELFEEPIFIYPVTSLTFGCAMHLIGSVDRLTRVILEQILSVLKWLATVAGVILALFAIALLFNLPGLVFEGRNAVGATWLLWLVAGMVLLLNAAYRDGSVTTPYPAWLSLALRLIVPLLIVVSLTALYALMVRTRRYGLTVERFWAYVVAVSALAYSLGYSIAALGRGPWLAAMSRVNILVAVVLITVIGLTFTPMLSPMRLAADSQFHLVEHKGLDNHGRYGSPVWYLRFSTGSYGIERLRQLAESYAGPDAEHVRLEANTVLAMGDRWQISRPVDLSRAVAGMRVFPAGRVMDAALLKLVTVDAASNVQAFPTSEVDTLFTGVYVDLDHDGVDEFVLLSGFRNFAYAFRDGTWMGLGPLTSQSSPCCQTDWQHARQNQIDALSRGEISVKMPHWSDLVIGQQVYRLDASK